MNVCAFIHSEQIERYRYPSSCPFKTERAALTVSILKKIGIYTGHNKMEVPPIPATEEELKLFHTQEYIEALKKVSKGNFDLKDIFMGLGTEDTPIFSDLFPYSTLAAGGTITAARLILEGKAVIAFNPSGGYHHAFKDKAGGFCYINDIVLGCMIFACAGKRVFCLDLDAHHGNGTQNAFYSNPNVFTVSFHESGKTLYPWSGFENEIGEGPGLGYNVNVPLPAGTGDEDFANAFKAVVPPLIDFFSPDVIVLEIGMDILKGDPLTHLSMSNNAIADAIVILLGFGKPILATGGGGYNPESTARGWALAWSMLSGNTNETDLYIGLGGTFLGNSEWNEGLRDMHSYSESDKRIAINREISTTIEWIKKNVFTIHGI